MSEQLFGDIKSEYDNFYRGLLKKGTLPMWGTSKGFWNASISDEVFQTFKKINLFRFKNLLDIGSGDGKVVMIASLFCNKAEGVEIDEFLHKKAEEFKSLLNIKNVVLHNKDFFDHDFSKYDALFLSPDGPLQRGLEKKLLKEMKGILIHYGNHFHPASLKKKTGFFINGTKVGIYTK